MANPQGPVTGPVKSYIADGPITAGCAVAFGTLPGHIIAVSAAGQAAAGIADTSGVVGQAVRVTRFGDTSAIAGGAITHGALLKTDINGHLVPVTGTAGGGENVVGWSESDALANGDLITVCVSRSVL